MATMLIDGTKEQACRTAEANAIRAKTGSSAQISYDFANNKGFADAIAAIETGGGAQVISIDNGDGTQDIEITDDGSSVVLVPKTVTENGTYDPADDNADGYSEFTVNVPTGSTKNVQVAASMARIVNKTSMTASGVKITVAKTGSYKCSWMHYAAAAGSSSSNYSTQLYKNNSAIGSSTYCPIYNNTTASNFLVTYTTTLNEGDSLEIRGRTRSGSSYYTVCGMLMIEEQ